MNSTEASLTVRQGVVIASRALCVLCLFNALINLSYFPSYIAGALHAWRTYSNAGFASADNYLTGVYVRDIAVGTLRLALEFFFALYFYRSGPKVAKFLLADNENDVQNAAS